MNKSREAIKNFFAKDENENNSSEEACLLNESQPSKIKKNQIHDVDYTLKILKENSQKQIQMSDSEESSSSLEELPDFNPAAVRANFGQACNFYFFFPECLSFPKTFFFDFIAIFLRCWKFTNYDANGAPNPRRHA